MTYEATGRLLLTPVDKEAPARVRRLRELGLGERPEPGLDAFADRLARIMDAPYAMVTFIHEEQQFFAGLHLPDATERPPDAAEPPAASFERRTGRERGYCPLVVVRGRALVLAGTAAWLQGAPDTATPLPLLLLLGGGATLLGARLRRRR